MRSRNITLVGALIVVVILIAVAVPAQAPRDAGDVTPVAVTNFPATFKVEGSVSVRGPIQDTSLQSLGDVVVPPVRRDDTTHYVEAGTVTTDGFSYAVVSLLGELKGQPQRPGDIGVILIPEEDRVLRAFAEKGQLLLAEEAKGNPHLELVGSPQPLPFDAAGNLVQEKLFPHSVRGRRGKAGH